ncbi:sigma-70 family RNA polymerase sigma factor [Peribacillus sp. SCS-26]|uniref:sigma-70 family RNA polymerase sigma factor n=1 Tax=Paraperibacillus marinus TaxID=3115295 RepID=UPI0039066E00
MKWQSATNEELMLIIKDDKSCPAHLLHGVVHESLERGLFNKLIYWVFQKLMKDWRKTVEAWNMENQDILSIGYCGVLIALSRWKPGKSSFKTYAYLNIRSEFIHLLDAENTKKREINKHTSSYDVPMESGEPLITTFSSKSNVEKAVIRKIAFETKLCMLDPQEKDILIMFLRGYSFREIGKQVFTEKTYGPAVREKFYEALNKIGLGHFTIEQPKAVKHSQQKLNEEIVREIRESNRQFKTKQEEADYYGISRKLIFNIRKNKVWKEVV